jgi:hypothetical protein
MDFVPATDLKACTIEESLGGRCALSNGDGVTIAPHTIVATTVVSIASYRQKDAASRRRQDKGTFPALDKPQHQIIGTIKDYRPSGLQFSAAATITMQYDPGIAASICVPKIFWLDEDRFEWVAMTSYFDAAAKIVSAPVEHFSLYALVEICNAQTSTNNAACDANGNCTESSDTLRNVLIIIGCVLLFGVFLCMVIGYMITTKAKQMKEAMKSQAGYDALKHYADRHKEEPRKEQVHIADVALPEATLKHMVVVPKAESPPEPERTRQVLALPAPRKPAPTAEKYVEPGPEPVHEVHEPEYTPLYVPEEEADRYAADPYAEDEFGVPQGVALRLPEDTQSVSDVSLEENVWPTIPQRSVLDLQQVQLDGM